MSEIFKLTAEFNADTHKRKVNGTIGVIVDDDGEPYVMSCVKNAIKNLTYDNFDYLPIAGNNRYLNKVKSFLNLRSHKIQSTVGGTNALYLWSQLNIDKRLIIRKPTWENHYNIFKDYELFEWKTIGELKRLMKRMPMVTTLFQISHNPTGKDINFKKVAKLGNPVLFDVAYLGLGENLYEDISKIHLFNDPCVAVSFSKIMTLYQHRTGALLTKRDWDMEAEFRRTNSNPPAFGQLIARQLIGEKEWVLELSKMKKMIDKRRFTKGTGLYSLLPVDTFKLKRKGIYLLSNGRINYGGVPYRTISHLKKVCEK